MAEAHAEVELPKALVKRLIKNKLSELSGDPHKEYQVNKDALLAFSESAKVFISFIASTANDICKEKHRHTLNAEDVFQALEEMEFADMVAPLRALLKEHKDAAKLKKKPEDKKRKAAEVEGAKDQEAPAAEEEEEEGAAAEEEEAADDAADRDDDADDAEMEEAEQ